MAPVASVTTGVNSRLHKPSRLLRISNCAGFVVLITINVLSNLGTFGATNADVSAKFPTPLTPAGWAFSIWGVIFLLQGAATVYQALPMGYDQPWKRAVVQAIGYNWQLGWYLECAWQVAFVQQSQAGMLIALVFIVSALGAFLVAWMRLQAQMEDRKTPISGWHYLAFVVPTSINAAWLSVASSLQTLIVAETYATHSKDLDILAVGLAVIVVLAGTMILARRRDAPYGLTLLWALVAVAGGHRSKLIRYVCFVSIAVLGLFSMFALTRHRPAQVEDSDDEDNFGYQQSLLEARGSRALDTDLRAEVGIEVQ